MNGRNAVRLVELALGVATVLTLVWAAAPGRRPWEVVSGCVRRAMASGRRLLYVGGFLLILLANYAYLASGVDERCTAWVVARRGSDYAEPIHRRVEGDAVARVQAAVAWTPLTWLLGYAYVVVFPCLVFAAMIAFDHAGSRRGLALVLAGYLANYLLVLPFYMLVPVRETYWYYQESALGAPAARLLLDDISPVVMELYRPMSGIDNCFPSFHTSLSVTMALAAWHAGRRFGWVMTGAAAAIVLSTVYLGIHWLTDAAAGLGVGLLAYGVARLISRRWRAEGGRG